MRKGPLSGATGRVLRLVLGVVTIGPLAAGRAVADSSDVLRFSAIANAYQTRQALLYTQMLQRELDGVRYLEPSVCASRQFDLISVGRKRGFDGLESLALAHHDCVARSGDPQLQQKNAGLAAELARYLWFAAKPVPNLPQRVARRDVLVERGVETAAVRSVLRTLAKQGTDSADLTLGQLLQHPAVEQALCDLPLRPGPDGRASGASLVRVAMCEALGTPGGRGALEDLCGPDASGRAAYEKVGTADAESFPAGATEKDTQGASDLASATCRGGVGFASLPGVDSLDAFSVDSCLGGDLFDQAGAVDVAQLVQDCFSAEDDGGYRDPAASDGDDETQPQPAEEPPADAPKEEEEEKTSDSNTDSGDDADGAGSTGDGTTSAATKAVGQTVGAIGDAANVLEAQMIFLEAVGGEAAAGAGLVAEVAGPIGMAITISTIAVEVYDSLVSLSEYTRQNGDCWPNCQNKDGTGTGTGGFDPQNEACKTLVDLGLVSPGAAIEESEFAPIAIVQPSPEAEEFAASSAGFCGAGVGVGLDDAVRCRMDKDCGEFADLGSDCSCRPRAGSAAAWLAQASLCAVILECPEGSSVVSASGQCFCDSGDPDEIEGRWGQPGAPDPVGGGEPLR